MRKDTYKLKEIKKSAISGIEILSLLKIAVLSKSINSEQQWNWNRFSYFWSMTVLILQFVSKKILRRVFRGMGGYKALFYWPYKK